MSRQTLCIRQEKYHKNMMENYAKSNGYAKALNMLCCEKG